VPTSKSKLKLKFTFGTSGHIEKIENKFQEDVSKMKIYETSMGANDTFNQPNKDDELLGGEIYIDQELESYCG
jgi:hypothetical protein